MRIFFIGACVSFVTRLISRAGISWLGAKSRC